MTCAHYLVARNLLIIANVTGQTQAGSILDPVRWIHPVIDIILMRLIRVGVAR